MHPVVYDERKLSPAELNYPIHEKKLLAIKHAIRVWFYYIDNNHKTLILTDHESLKYLQTMKNPSKRLARWVSEFSEYNLEIKYRKGSEAVVPDAINRRPDLMGNVPRNRTLRLNLIMRGIDENEWFQAMTGYLLSKKKPGEKLRKYVMEDAENFEIVNDDAENSVLYRKLANNEKVSSYLQHDFR